MIGGGGCAARIGTCASSDIMVGGDGNDTLFAPGPDSDLFGGNGDDQLLATGAAGVDSLDGGAGNDTLTANDAGDTLFAGNGNDSLIGGAGAAPLHARPGQDTLL